MREANNLLQRFFSDNERFADLINGYIGSDILTASDLLEKDTQLAAYVGDKENQVSISRLRDIIRKATVGMDFILIGIENQKAVHYAMPIRSMLYDAMGYDEQLKNIAKCHKERKDLKGAEFLSGFSKEDRVNPVFTLIVYYGKERWDASIDLYGLMNIRNIPSKIRKLVPNYPINLLEVNSFQSIERFKTDIKAVFGFLQNAGSDVGLKNFIAENKEAFEELDEDAYDIISHLSDAKELIAVKSAYKKERGYNMCEAIQKMMETERESGKEEGKEIGLAEGKAEGMTVVIETICKKLEKNKTAAEIAEILELESEYIQTVANIKEKYPNHSALELARELIKNKTLESK